MKCNYSSLQVANAAQSGLESSRQTVYAHRIAASLNQSASRENTGMQMCLVIVNVPAKHIAAKLAALNSNPTLITYDTTPPYTQQVCANFTQII